MKNVYGVTEAWRSRVRILNGGQVPEGEGSVLDKFYECYIFTWINEPFDSKKDVKGWFASEAKDYPHWQESDEHAWWLYHLIATLAFTKRFDGDLARHLVQAMLDSDPPAADAAMLEVNYLLNGLYQGMGFLMTPKLDYARQVGVDRLHPKADAFTDEITVAVAKLGQQLRRYPMESFELPDLVRLTGHARDPVSFYYDTLAELLLKNITMAYYEGAFMEGDRLEAIDQEVEAILVMHLNIRGTKHFAEFFAFLREAAEIFVDKPHNPAELYM